MTTDEMVLPVYLDALRDSSSAVDESSAGHLYFLLASKLSHYEALFVARPALLRRFPTSSSKEWHRAIEELLAHDLYKLYWSIDRLTFKKSFRTELDLLCPLTLADDDSATSTDGLLRFCNALKAIDWGSRIDARSWSGA